MQGCRGGRACEVCGKLLNTERAVEDHMRNVHRDTIFPCGNCNRTFKTNSALTLYGYIGGLGVFDPKNISHPSFSINTFFTLKT